MKLWWPYSGFLDWHLQRRWAWRPTEESRDIKVQRCNTLTPRWKPWLVQTWVVPFDENMRYKVFLQLKGEVEKMVHKENPPNSFWWGRTLWDITDGTRGWLKWLPAVDNCRKRLKVTNRWKDPRSVPCWSFCYVMVMLFVHKIARIAVLIMSKMGCKWSPRCFGALWGWPFCVGFAYPTIKFMVGWFTVLMFL
jgi:hypothetical protein